MLDPCHCTLDTTQMAIPAGIAKTTARHSTISVRSMRDV